MLLSTAWDQFLTFVKEDYVLLIIIAIAIILLIVVSILGRNKKDKTSEKTTSGVAVEDAEHSNSTNAESSSVDDAATEAVEQPAEAATAVVEEAPVVEEKPVAEETPAVEEQSVAEETPAVEEQSVAEETAVVEEAPAVEEEAAVVEEQSVVEQKADTDTEDLVSDTDEANENTEGAEKRTRPGVVELYKGKNDFYFTFRSVHGYLIGRSQGYASKDGCKNGIKSVMATCAEAEIYDNCGKKAVEDYVPQIGKAVFEIYNDKAGMFRFRLYAKNQNNIASSEDYTTKASLKSAIESLRKIANHYTFIDSTLKKKKKA